MRKKGTKMNDQDEEAIKEKAENDKPRPTLPGSDVRDLPPVDPRKLREPK
jgi:hypothetical protein